MEGIDDGYGGIWLMTDMVGYYWIKGYKEWGCHSSESASTNLITSLNCDLI